MTYAKQQYDSLAKYLEATRTASDASGRIAAVTHLVNGARVLQQEIVTEACAAGTTWQEVGAILGVSKQAAHERFAARDAIVREIRRATRR